MLEFKLKMVEQLSVIVYIRNEVLELSNDVKNKEKDITEDINCFEESNLLSSINRLIENLSN